MLDPGTVAADPGAGLETGPPAPGAGGQTGRMGTGTDHVIRTEAELRELIGHPAELVCSKVTDRLNDLTREYVDRSPFVLIATADADGACDVSPRGDPTGFVRVLDERTLLLPERPGNRIADTLTNLLANPNVGLLFLVPGATETFRVNGTAALTTDPVLLAPSAVEGRVPKLGIVVTVEQAYTQCSKAVLRAHLWDPERFVDQQELPSNGEIMRAINGEDIDPQEYDAARAERYARREGFY